MFIVKTTGSCAELYIIQSPKHANIVDSQAI